MTKSVKEIEHVMNVGNQNRAVGSVYIVSFWSNSVILAVFYLKMQLIYITLMFVSKIIIHVLRIFIVS